MAHFQEFVLGNNHMLPDFCNHRFQGTIIDKFLLNQALGVVSRDDNVIESLDNWNPDDSIIVISGTTAETYLVENYPDIQLQKFDSYATAKEAFENGTSAAWANDNTEVIAFALQNDGHLLM